jgi:hypothetical protein
MNLASEMGLGAMIYAQCLVKNGSDVRVLLGEVNTQTHRETGDLTRHWSSVG